MLRLSALVVAILVGTLGVAMAAPGSDAGLSIPAITTVETAEAAIGRGEGGGDASGAQVSKRGAGWLQSFFTPLFFIGLALGLTALVVQRNAGAAVALLVASVVIGAFLLVPDQVESFYRSIYQFVF